MNRWRSIQLQKKTHQDELNEKYVDRAKQRREQEKSERGGDRDDDGIERKYADVFIFIVARLCLVIFYSPLTFEHWFVHVPVGY